MINASAREDADESHETVVALKAAEAPEAEGVEDGAVGARAVSTASSRATLSPGDELEGVERVRRPRGGRVLVSGGGGRGAGTSSKGEEGSPSPLGRWMHLSPLEVGEARPP